MNIVHTNISEKFQGIDFRLQRLDFIKAVKELKGRDLKTNNVLALIINELVVYALYFILSYFKNGKLHYIPPSIHFC